MKEAVLPLAAAGELRQRQDRAIELLGHHLERPRDLGDLVDAVAAKQLNWLPMDDKSFVMRSVAQGRLVDCLDIGGGCMLRTAPDDAGRSLALPLRLAAVDRKLYVLR